MQRKQVIGILVNRNSGEAYAGLKIKHDFNLIYFNPEDINWRRRTIRGLYRTKYGLHYKSMPIPLVIYNRLYPHDSETIKQLMSLRPPVQVFNQITQLDKWIIYKELVETELEPYLPRTYEYDMAGLHEALADHQQVVLKPRIGRQGAGIWRLTVKPANQLKIEHELPLPILLPYSEAMMKLLHILMIPYTMIIQEYIDLAKADGASFDIRALVQKNRCGDWEVTAITSRVAEKNHYITNIYEKILLTSQLLSEYDYPTNKILACVEDLSVTAAEKLEKALGHLGEISVDIGLDQSCKPWIIEVNGKPDKLLYGELDNPDLLQKVQTTPLEYASFLGSKKRRL